MPHSSRGVAGDGADRSGAAEEPSEAREVVVKRFASSSTGGRVTGCAASRPSWLLWRLMQPSRTARVS